MKKTNELKILEELGYDLKPLNNQTYLKLYVKGDENDADYVSEEYYFSFDEFEKVNEIAKELNSLGAHWNDNASFDEDEDEDKDYELIEYIPSGQHDFVHTIEDVNIEICINGVKYSATKK